MDISLSVWKRQYIEALTLTEACTVGTYQNREAITLSE